MAKNKSLRMKYAFNVEATKTGFSAHSPQFGAVTTGDTLEQLRTNAAAAINLTGRSKAIVSPWDIRFNMDVQTFFKGYKILKAGPLAKRINMDSTLLSHYVTGKKKPSEAQLRRITTAIREIAGELTTTSFLLPKTKPGR